jgi:pimeloyl-ACP methyl ester carboxylesterase
MKKKLGVLGGILGLVLLIGVVARFAFPIQTVSLWTHLKLWRAGVRSFYVDGISGLVRDHCDPVDPEARGCTCVALIHGLGDQPETWDKLLMAPRKYWAKPVKLYALRVLRNQRYLDDEPAEKYGARAQALQIADALAPLCNQWVIVGNSMGGWEATWIALEGKLRVSKLILLDSVGTRSSAAAARFFGADPTVESTKELWKHIYFKAPPIPDDFWPHIVDLVKKERMDKIIAAQKEEDLVDGRLTTLRVPTMVLWGKGDTLVPDTVGQEIHSLIPGSIWRDVPECGHVPERECHLAVIQAINEMLRFGAS